METARLEAEAKATAERIAGFVGAHKAVSAAAAVLVAGAVYLRAKSRPAALPTAPASSGGIDTAGSVSPIGSDAGGGGVSGAAVAPSSAYTSADLQAAAQTGYTAGMQTYGANYPQQALQGAAVSAAQSAGQNTAANCRSITQCGGHSGSSCGFFSFFCGPIMNLGDCVLGGVVRTGACAGSAALTLATGASAAVLPALQTGLQGVAAYTPQILAAKFGLPGISAGAQRPVSTPPIRQMPGYLPSAPSVMTPPTYNV